VCPGPGSCEAAPSIRCEPRAAPDEKRSSLQALKRKRLLQLAETFEIDVASRAKQDELVDALAAAKSVSHENVLTSLNRAELVAICDAHELDGTGDKVAIVARILGHGADVTSPEPAKATAPDTSKSKRKKKLATVEDNGKTGNGGVLGFESQLWGMADQLWTNSGLQPSEYSTPVLALIFLKYADHKFAQVETELAAKPRRRGKVSKDDYLAHGVLFVPDEARFQKLLELPEGSDVGKAVNDAMKAIEAENPELKDVLPKTYAKFERSTLASLLKIFGTIPPESSGDVFGRVYEYFLGNFAPRTLQKGGEYFTPESVVKLIVEIVEPYHGRILDPACGSGGMFIQSAKFIAEHKKNPSEEISIHGIEKISQTLRLAKMSLAVHGLSGDIREANSYYEDPHDCVGKFDFVMANPPFNQSAVDKDRVKDDKRRFPFGMPNVDNANYLWIQLFYAALNSKGRAGFVMANSAATASGTEGSLREKLVATDSVDVIVELTSNLFYTVTLPVTLWFLNKDKSPQCRGKVLLLDARSIFRQVDRSHREVTHQQSEYLANIVRLFRGEIPENRYGGEQLLLQNFPNAKYCDVRGLCKVTTLEDVAKHEYSLNPGRYVGIADQPRPDDGHFSERFQDLSDRFRMLTEAAHELEARLAATTEALLRGSQE
jgi:type I restriction enzyme M protein